MNRPTVSVVIPTIGRADVARAVHSVLRQSEPVSEILVVADTLDEFDLPADIRIRVLRVGPAAGGNTARQAGIDAAEGDVIGLLDDDDEWHEDKVRMQLDEAARALTSDWIISSRVVLRRSKTDSLIQPGRPLGPDESIVHYMFRKSSPRAGHGFLQASTLMFPRHLGVSVGFDRTLRFHQDISWLVDVATALPEVELLQVWEPLVTYNSTQGSVSKRIDPMASINWAQVRLQQDRRTMGDFILTQSLGFARRTGSVWLMCRVLVSGMRVARPGTAAIIYALGAIVKTAIGARR